jgi:formylglycine-generating enzyme required for sulfatase activity
MRKLLSVLALFTISLFLVQTTFANNVAISNIGLTVTNTTEKHTMVQFDLTWENSWRNNVNCDAAWVFAKFSLDDGGTWMHASLDTTGHTAPAGATIHTPGDARGVFIYRDANGAGTVNFNPIQIRWNYGADGLADDAVVQVKVFAIEMVLVPEATFAAGSGGTGPDEFTMTTINTADATIAGGFPTGQTAANNPSWPNGFSAFYCMKYEISQGQYADFLNTLTSTQAATRNPESSVNPSSGRYSITGSHPNFSAAKPFVACSYLSWMDGVAYADWAGLRPMTELEYEKACRGDQAPVADEFAWGSTNITAATGISNDGAENEVPGNAGANCVNGDNADVKGPMRGGCFATASSSREQAGASFYGIMELSGNLWERSVTIGNTAGRSFTGTMGDGSLSANGNATNNDWPGFAGGEVTNALGSGARGGAWDFMSLSVLVGNRYHATTDFAGRGDVNGFRCVRSTH